MIFFRADSNSQIGMGHLMRCLSVAGKLKEMTDVSFLCAYESASDFVIAKGIEAKTLNSAPFSPEEVPEILEILSDKDIIVLDSYLYSENYVKDLRKKVKVIIFDDMIATPFEASALINYNTYASLEGYISLYESKKEHPLFILGGEYAPLRDEFSNATKEFSPIVKNILITTGGGDSENLGGEIASRLLSDLSMDIQIHLVCGAVNPFYDEWCRLAKDKKNLEVHRCVTNMAELMRRCDLAVSAGGSTCYELCATGVPFVVFSFAENQKKLARNMQDEGVAVFSGNIENGDSRKAVIDSVIQNIHQLIEDDALRKGLYDRCNKLVDGQGARRLAEMIYKIMEGKS